MQVRPKQRLITESPDVGLGLIIRRYWQEYWTANSSLEPKQTQQWRLAYHKRPMRLWYLVAVIKLGTQARAFDRKLTARGP
jgi:hypothetical protein